MMYTDDFEAAFAQFLDRHEYDEAENYLFSMIRLAFAAGWQSAGGDPPKAARIYELLTGGGKPGKPETRENHED